MSTKTPSTNGNGSNSTKSGILRLSNGESVIPASTRADGTVRKEIRVKPGYRPPEDVEVYKNRTAEAWKNRGKAGVPGATKVAGVEGEDEPGFPIAPHRAAAAKNAKRREARKKAASSSNGGAEDRAGNGDGGKTAGEAQAEELVVDPEAEAAKEAKKLAKKLRQARELKEKKEKGGDLLPEQFAKVIKIQELMRQLEGLGFDADGERKGEKKMEESKLGREEEEVKAAG